MPASIVPRGLASDGSERRRDAAIRLGRGPDRPYERDLSLVAAFESQASRTPHAVAVRDGSTEITYGELDRRANRLAHYLRSLGVSSETPVGVAFERSIEIPAVLLAILKAGGAYVALDASYPPERLAYLIADCKIRYVVTCGPLCAAWPSAGLVLVDVLADAAIVSAHRAEALLSRRGPEALAYVAYTSGSTGRPKGVAIVDRGVVRLVRGQDYVAIQPNDIFLHFAPLAFDASTFEIWAPLLNGASLAIAPPGTVALDQLGRLFDRFGVTTAWLTSSLFRLMAGSELRAFRGLRQLLVGGDVVPVAQAQQFVAAFPNCRLINGYGPTENTTFSCCYRIASPESIQHGVPIGRPISNSSAYVLDETMNPPPLGTPGELYVGGDGLARGYVNLPEPTADRFVSDPFSDDPRARLYRTGDLARVRPDGNLEFLGRVDHQVKIRGFRVELAEVENVLRSHPAVVDAALSVVTARTDKALFAHVVLVPKSELDEAGLRSYLAKTLPQHMLPARFAFLEALPTHNSGKLDRAELSRLAQQPARPATATATASEPSGKRAALQRAVARCWREALGTSGEPAIDENFFDAGGDSLRLLALHVTLQKQVGIEFDVVDLFAQTTIRKLVAFLSARAA